MTAEQQREQVRLRIRYEQLEALREAVEDELDRIMDQRVRLMNEQKSCTVDVWAIGRN